MHACMHVCMSVCVCVYTYMCIYIYTFLLLLSLLFILLLLLILLVLLLLSYYYYYYIINMYIYICCYIVILIHLFISLVSFLMFYWAVVLAFSWYVRCPVDGKITFRLAQLAAMQRCSSSSTRQMSSVKACSDCSEGHVPLLRPREEILPGSLTLCLACTNIDLFESHSTVSTHDI